jgi:magnesium-transporting ATPase (P-type)
MLGYSGSGTQEVSKSILASSITIFVFIVNYLLFEWQKHKLSERNLEILNATFIVSIICFATLILLLGLFASRNILNLDWLQSFTLLFALLGTLVFPLFGVIIMVFNYLIDISKR